MSEYAGPMGLANQEIRDAMDGFMAERLSGRRLPALVERTDAMLTELETLNLMEARHTSTTLRAALTALVADLPFEYTPRIGPRPSPTAAIEVVFEIQAGIFNLIYGSEPSDLSPEPADQLIEVAS
jgi:hypothetical protein